MIRIAPFHNPPARRAFSLVELMVVIGIIGYLIALLLPVLNIARATAVRTQCAANLRQIGYAIEIYAIENAGWTPRDCTLGRDDRAPWMMLFARYLGGDKNLVQPQLPEVRVLQCPAHPVENIPTGYVINAFAFETEPNWAPDGPIKRSSVSRPSELPWVLEAADEFVGVDSADGESPMIFGVQFHDCYDPEHLPRGSLQRLIDDRHVKRTANVLYFDSHVATIRRGELKLQMFDDGLRKHATPFPETGF